MTGKWIKTGRTVSAEGTTTIYELEGTTYQVESRKRHIPHANGIGTWAYTSYWVVHAGIDVIEKHSLTEAKAWVANSLLAQAAMRELEEKEVYGG